MGQLDCVLHCNNSLKRTFVHLTFNQVVAGSIPARPTKYQALTSVLKFPLSQSIGIVPIRSTKGGSTAVSRPCYLNDALYNNTVVWI